MKKKVAELAFNYWFASNLVSWMRNELRDHAERLAFNSQLQKLHAERVEQAVRLGLAELTEMAFKAVRAGRPTRHRF